MIAYQPTNTLIISDTGYKVRRVLDIIDLLDVQTQQPKLVSVPIKFSDAKSVADKVRQLVSRSTRSKRSSSARDFKILVDERSNSVFIFGPPRTIKDVRDMVKKFDIELEDPSKQATIHVRPLDYADAKTLATTLSALMQRGRTSRLRRRTNKSRTSYPTVAQLDDNVKITAYEPSNSLLITGSRSAYQALNAIIRKLDMRRSQVYVEADILDISDKGQFEAGLSAFAGAKAGKVKAITGWEGKGGISSLLQASMVASGGVEGAEAIGGALKGVQQTFAHGMTVGILSGTEIDLPGLGKIAPGALIRLIKSDANTKVLATPQILTSNNEVAKLVVGETRLFETASQSATGAITRKLEKENADLSLKIKPNISHSNYVTLKIDLEATSFGLLGENKLPNINKRQTSQIVTAKNGQTVVISGLVKTEEQELFAKVPLLGDIPILGWLFRNTNLVNTKSNLVIFLKPHIIHSADDLAQIYRQKIEERDQFLDSVGSSTKDNDDFYSLLPKISEGEYQADEMDQMERQKLEEMRRELYEIISDETNSGYQLRPPQTESPPPPPEPPAEVTPPVVETPPPVEETPATETPPAETPPTTGEEETTDEQEAKQ